jgi:hypothetical protein
VSTRGKDLPASVSDISLHTRPLAQRLLGPLPPLQQRLVGHIRLIGEDAERNILEAAAQNQRRVATRDHIRANRRKDKKRAAGRRAARPTAGRSGGRPGTIPGWTSSTRVRRPAAAVELTRRVVKDLKDEVGGDRAGAPRDRVGADRLPGVEKQ